MISLSKAQDIVAELCPDFVSFVCTDLVLTEWANKGVISGIELRDGIALYPKIIVIEILTAVKLKKTYNYSLKEIAESRKYLNLNNKNLFETEENNFVNLINLKKIYNDKKVVLKNALGKIDSIIKMKNIIDELYQENKKLEIMTNYCLECSKAKKEVTKINPGLLN